MFISEDVSRLEIKEKKVQISFKNGRILQVDTVLFCGGRVANTDSLDLHLCKTKIEIGALNRLPKHANTHSLYSLINSGQYGRLVVDSKYCTTHPNIYAIGDAVGGNLASTAFLQGRSVSNILFNQDNKSKKSQDEGIPNLTVSPFIPFLTNLLIPLKMMTK